MATFWFLRQYSKVTNHRMVMFYYWPEYTYMAKKCYIGLAIYGGRWLLSENGQHYDFVQFMPDGNGGFMPCPDLLTEDELIRFLRIPQISSAKDYHNVIEHLKRYRGLPRISICNRILFPKEAILKWIERETTNEN
jgi:hypothetical protein